MRIVPRFPYHVIALIRHCLKSFHWPAHIQLKTHLVAAQRDSLLLCFSNPPMQADVNPYLFCAPIYLAQFAFRVYSRLNNLPQHNFQLSICDQMRLWHAENWSFWANLYRFIQKAIIPFRKTIKKHNCYDINSIKKYLN